MRDWRPHLWISGDIQMAALGSGLASGFAPFVLGRLSDVTNLRTAYPIVAALMVVLAVYGAIATGAFLRRALVTQVRSSGHWCRSSCRRS